MVQESSTYYTRTYYVVSTWIFVSRKTTKINTGKITRDFWWTTINKWRTCVSYKCYLLLIILIEVFILIHTALSIAHEPINNCVCIRVTPPILLRRRHLVAIFSSPRIQKEKYYFTCNKNATYIKQVDIFVSPSSESTWFPVLLACLFWSRLQEI